MYDVDENGMIDLNEMTKLVRSIFKVSNQSQVTLEKKNSDKMLFPKEDERVCWQSGCEHLQEDGCELWRHRDQVSCDWRTGTRCSPLIGQGGVCQRVSGGQQSHADADTSDWVGIYHLHGWILELSTNLREVSQCPEKAPNTSRSSQQGEGTSRGLLQAQVFQGILKNIHPWWSWHDNTKHRRCK